MSLVNDNFHPHRLSRASSTSNLNELPTSDYPKRVSPAPRVVHSQDDGPRLSIPKRIVACCDGTWQDALSSNENWKFTNVLRLARAIRHEDSRTNPPIPQVVFYQAGVGTSNFTSRIVDGATGFAVEEKVEEVYNFISQNYAPGDEIFLFGFSRGAYTARMVAQFIGEIGVLDSSGMDHFADIFEAFQARGTTDDPEEKKKHTKFLEPWVNPDAHGRRRAGNGDPLAFSVKCVGVWDTVGAIGIPSDLPIPTDAIRLFGFNDRHLGSHIQRAYHAMALNELRKSFDVCKFEMTNEGRSKGQILKQVWFAVVHTDVGGGYEQHDLADITLGWMAAHVEDIISLDLEYLRTRVQHPTAAYGKQLPNDSRTGIFSFTRPTQRSVPYETNSLTHEWIHPSALLQEDIQPVSLKEIIEKNPRIVTKLLPLEEEIIKIWPVKEHGTAHAAIDAAKNGSNAETSTETNNNGSSMNKDQPFSKPSVCDDQDERSGIARQIGDMISPLL